MRGMSGVRVMRVLGFRKRVQGLGGNKDSGFGPQPNPKTKITPWTGGKECLVHLTCLGAT